MQYSTGTVLPKGTILGVSVEEEKILKLIENGTIKKLHTEYDDWGCEQFQRHISYTVYYNEETLEVYIESGNRSGYVDKFDFFDRNIMVNRADSFYRNQV